jgi:tetratricopeptide (TPR) repeat protein
VRAHDAIGHIDLAQAIYTERLGADHVRTIDCILLRAEALYRQRRIDEAIAMFEHAIEAYRGAESANPEDVARGLERMGSVLAQLGRHAEAEPLLREAAGLYAARRGEADPDLALTRSRLGCTLAALGQPETARTLLLQARPVLEETFGRDDLRVRELRTCLDRLP